MVFFLILQVWHGEGMPNLMCLEQHCSVMIRNITQYLTKELRQLDPIISAKVYGCYLVSFLIGHLYLIGV